MNRKVWVVVALALIFWLPISAEAREERPPWRILDEALTYLHAVPEVAWVKFVGDNIVVIGWEGLPKNFAQINKTAAKNAARALHNEVTVYSLPPGQTLTSKPKGYDAPFFLCKTTANPHEIVDSNCR